MTSHSSHASRHHAPTGLLTPGQTLLCFLGGIIAMFMVVSVVFAMKLSAEGRLPSLSKLAKAETVAPPPALKKPAPSNSAVSPPITASVPSRGEQTVEPSLIRPDGNATFVPGTENLLPAEVAHLAKDASPANSVEGRPPTPTATVTVTPAHVESTPPAGVLPRAAAAYAATSSRTPPDDIRKFISEWASAWQRKDADAYLKHYADDFSPAGGITHSAWLRQRKERLGRPGEISIQISDLDIDSKGSDVTARFTQSYSAQGKTLRETKTLLLALRDGRWLIRQERIGQ